MITLAFGPFEHDPLQVLVFHVNEHPRVEVVARSFPCLKLEVIEHLSNGGPRSPDPGRPHKAQRGPEPPATGRSPPAPAGATAGATSAPSRSSRSAPPSRSHVSRAAPDGTLSLVDRTCTTVRPRSPPLVTASGVLFRRRSRAHEAQVGLGPCVDALEGRGGRPRRTNASSFDHGQHAGREASTRRFSQYRSISSRRSFAGNSGPIPGRQRRTRALRRDSG
jgi:hypothetical protein